MKLNQLIGPLAAAVLLGLASSASALTQDEANAILFMKQEDIADLREYITATRERPIKNVFSNLLNGSLNHLAALTRWLK